MTASSTSPIHSRDVATPDGARPTRATAVTNSASQAAYIRTTAAGRGLDRVHVVVADIAEFTTAQRFDRVVSVEMLEHVRNCRALFERIAGWLSERGVA